MMFPSSKVFLSQAIGAGIGAGMIYVPSVSIVSQYFRKRRSTMMSFVAAGSSLGSVIHPIMLNNTLGKIGFANATRANAGLVAGLYLISCLLMRTRMPPHPNIMDIGTATKKFVRDQPYVLASLGYVLTFFQQMQP
jgi:MFS family permease